MKKKVLKIHQLLDQALAIAIDECNGAALVAEWIDTHIELEGYGYTEELEGSIGELEERIEELEERLEKFPNEERFQPLTHLVDSMKMEYFLEHFQEIPLEALEWIVQEMRNK